MRGEALMNEKEINVKIILQKCLDDIQVAYTGLVNGFCSNKAILERINQANFYIKDAMSIHKKSVTNRIADDAWEKIKYEE